MGWYGGGGLGRGKMPGWMRFGIDETNVQGPVKQEILRRQVEMLREELARIEALLSDEEAPEPEQAK
jgi:hypothetical protein